MKIYRDCIANSQSPEIDKTLVPPAEIALDRNNISILGKAILNEYKTIERLCYRKYNLPCFLV